ncbi:MAG: hypothetical protein R3B06_20175 [Kofleriaceae bacterium]
MIAFAGCLALGCGGDDGGGGGADGGGVDGGAALTCASLTLCTYAEVTQYFTPITAPAGGAIADGQYRLAWVETGRADDDGRLADLEALEIRGGQFRMSGGPRGDLGTWSTSGTDLTLHTTAYCDLSAPDGDADNTWTYRYTATPTELRIYDTGSSGASTWDIVRVWKRMGAADEACALVAAVPTTPGESAACWASNCFCAYAVNTTLPAASCPF